MTVDETVINNLTDKTGSEKKTGALDLDSKVKIDGKEVSVADLVATHKKAQEMQSSLAAAQRTLESAKILYGKSSPTAAAAEEAFRNLLEVAGRTPEEIEREIAETKGGGSNSQQQQSPQPQQRQQQQPEPVDRKMLDLLQKATSLQVTENMRAEVEKALKKSADLKAYVKHIEERDGAEAAEAFFDSNFKQAYNTLQMTISAQLDKTDDVSIAFGEKLSKAAEEAAKEIVGKARQYLGDPKRLGKSAGVASGEDPFQISDKPVERPRYEKGMATADLEARFEERMTDRLVRTVKAALNPDPNI